MARHLQEGDYLIVDNATVHAGYDSSPVLLETLDMAGVTLVYLPAYSPELNPCELVFNVVKRYIREHRGEEANIPEETLTAVSKITREHVHSFYQHCIFPSVVLPDLL